MSVVAAVIARQPTSATVTAVPPAPLAAWLGVSVLMTFAPFERLQPLLRLPVQQLSNVEALLLTVLAVWALALVLGRGASAARTLALVRSPLAAPLASLVFVMLAAALVAPSAESLRGNALNMAGRYGLGLLVYLLTVDAVSGGRLDRLLGVAVALAAVLSVVVLLDYQGVPAVRAWLAQFRTDIAHVGSQVRATGPFQYPTIGSMYLEILFALGLGFLLLMLERGRHRTAAIVVAVLLVVGQAVALTFTRAGLLTLLTSLAIVAALRLRERGLDRAVLILGAISLAIGLQFGASRSSEALRLRMSTEGRDRWYRASFEAPPTIEIPAGGTIGVPLSVTNTGRLTWLPDGSPPIRLSYHWLHADDDRVLRWEGLRTDFVSAVEPGQTAAMVARVEAPLQEGTYRLLWDLEEEHRLWFTTEPDATLATSRATVTGVATPPVAPTSFTPFPRSSARPGRLVLWRAAGSMLVDHPWTGVGPDNFRLLYGRYAGLANADTRVHSNNLYLEVLVSGGLVAGLALVWIGWRLATVSWGIVAPFAGHPAAPGIVAALAALAVHGVFDAFLAFTATYILTAIVIGLATGLFMSARAHAGGQ